MKHTTDTITLAKNGKTLYIIVYKFSGDVLLDPAVKDLAATLEEITGAKFPVAPKAKKHGIYIGVTPPGEKSKFASRERCIKSIGNDLYIYGDYRYGVAGAIYNFLREFCGCRWYTATGDKRIPKKPVLAFDAIDYRHVPSFKSIEHGSKDVFSANDPDIRDWVRRNNSFLMPNYAFGAPDDGWNYIGPVTHTLAAYLPPLPREPRTFNADGSFFAGPHPCFAGQNNFKEHPEYFTLNRDGERVPNEQLCFSNPKVRKLLLKNIETVIEAEHYDPARDAILDFSQNDKLGGFCHCPACRKLNEKHGTPGGVYFDFLVEMGKHFAKKYPRLTFRFFAYKEEMTGIPPTGIKFPDNLSVIIAPLQQDFSKPLSSRHNVRFLRQMEKWSKLCKEIWLWNYPTVYLHGIFIYSLFPGVYRNTENLRLAHENRVRYLIAEQGGGVSHGASFKELNVYLQTLMAENIDVDVEASIKEFCEAVYGKAAPEIINYLRETDRLCKRDPGFFIYHYDPRVMRRVLHTPENLIKWQRAFDRMERAVARDPRARFNVRRARLNLDAVTLLCYPKCAATDADFAARLPIDKLYRRYLRRVRDDARAEFVNYPEKGAEKEFTANFLYAARMVYEFNRREQNYPKELVKKYGTSNLFSIPPLQSRRPPAKWDKTSASGFAVEMPASVAGKPLTVQDIRVKPKDGLPWNTIKQVPLRHKLPCPGELKPGGYQLVYCGRSKLSPSGMVILETVNNGNATLRLSMRNARCFLGEVYDTGKPDQKYDFYLSVKPGRGGQSLFVDRLVVAKALR